MVDALLLKAREAMTVCFYVLCSTDNLLDILRLFYKELDMILYGQCTCGQQSYTDLQYHFSIIIYCAFDLRLK